jgi:hypothetical protein
MSDFDGAQAAASTVTALGKASCRHMDSLEDRLTHAMSAADGARGGQHGEQREGRSASPSHRGAVDVLPRGLQGERQRYRIFRERERERVLRERQHDVQRCGPDAARSAASFAAARAPWMALGPAFGGEDQFWQVKVRLRGGLLPFLTLP